MSRIHAKRIAAVILSLLTLTAAVFPCFAYNDAFSLGALGSQIVTSKENIAVGLNFYESYASNLNSEMQHAYVFDYAGGLGTEIDILYGDALSTGITLEKLLNGIDYNRAVLKEKQRTDDGSTSILAMTGGDSIDVRGVIGIDTALSGGVLYKDGRILATSNGRAALGIKEDGSVIIGKPDIRIDMYIGATHAVTPLFLNKAVNPDVDGVYLFTEEYGASCGTVQDRTELVMRIVSGDFIAGTQMLCLIESVDYTAHDTKIPEDCILVSVANDYSDYEHFKNNFLVGNTVILDVSCADGWSKVKTAVCAETMLTENNTVSDFTDASASQITDASKIAAGVKFNGSLVVCAFEATDDKSFAGMTMSEIAKFMLDSGCTNSVCLVSGGDINCAVKRTENAVATSVSDTDSYSEKPVAALVFGNTYKASDAPANIAAYPVNPYVLAGSTVVFDTYIYDASMCCIDNLNFTPLYNAAAASGTFTGNIYKAPDKAGIYKTTVGATVNGVVLSAENTVTVTNKIDKIEVTADADKCIPGASVPLKITAYYKNVPVIVSPDKLNFSFTATDPVGTVSTDGVLHISPAAVGVDRITVSCGDIYGTVDVAIINTQGENTYDDGYLHSFESGSISLDVWKALKSSDTITADITTVSGGQNNSLRSLYFAYNFPRLTVEENRYVLCRYNKKAAIDKNVAGVQMWAKNYSVEDDGAIYLTVEDDKGNQTDIQYAPVEGVTNGGWQYLAADFKGETYADIVVPIKVTDTGTEATGGVFTVDNIAFTDSIAAPVITPEEPQKPAEKAFADSDTVAWASEYIEKMYSDGYAEGSTGTDGKRYYHPANLLTRQEFAKMLVSFLGINTKLFGGISFGFTDASQIASWAEDYVKAVVSAQLMNGRLNSDGSYSFAPEDEITRQEVMQVFGKLIDGQATAALSFGDSHLIASWARDNVIKTVAAGIINGDNLGNLNPLGNVTRAEIAAIFIRSVGKLNFSPDGE